MLDANHKMLFVKSDLWKANSPIVATHNTFLCSDPEYKWSLVIFAPDLSLLCLVIYRPVHEILVKTALGMAVMCAWLPGQKNIFSP